VTAKFLAASTVARKIAALREWHRFLARRYKWPNPAAHLEDALVTPSSTLALSAEQIKTLLAAPDLSQLSGLRDYAILCLLCDGFSPQEISALRHEEGEEEFGETARGALQQYSTRVRPLLLARLRKKGHYSRRIFFTNRGTPLSPLILQQIVRRYARATQLPSWVSASHLYKMGAARRARGAAIGDDSGTEVAALPRVAQLRHVYAKAHPRA
jgi:integrase/recombinase XerD